MKSQGHALISLGFGAGIALIQHGSLFNDPNIYLAAVLGGECIDVIDHTLYHLVYRRNEPCVIAARKIFLERGIKAFWSFVCEIEARSGFKRLLLHNVYALAALILLSCALCILAPQAEAVLLFCAATILHMFTDMLCDVAIFGNIDNWLWVLPHKSVVGAHGVSTSRITQK